MLLLPLPTSPAYNVLTEIEGVEYELVYTYDEHRDLWRLGVNRGDVVVMGHRPLLPFVQMRPNAFTSALEGVFALIAPLPTDDAYEALTGGLWNVVYGDPSEIAELADSLADLAGDADIPVAPIEVLYPPNNAILSNPVVTFSGTGPANQMLFVRGESIQVDSMGGWSWTHTFNESNPVVVFEGESGQRATVRFSIIMQPLTINPIGEDINGTRYVFTESVEVTGTATPNSTITVNGQTVSVGGDGLWSTVLTLQAGQSHTITAQGGDGQVAQTSVYAWGEPDLMALEPDIWLDPVDASTLFVNAEGTIPCVPVDPVGLWVNKGTLGAAGDAKQAVSALRPIWDGERVVFGSGSFFTTSHRIASPTDIYIDYSPDPSGVGSYRGLFGSASGANNANNTFAQLNPVGHVNSRVRTTTVAVQNTPTYDGDERLQYSLSDTAMAVASFRDSESIAYEGPLVGAYDVTIGSVQASTFVGTFGDVLLFNSNLSVADIALLNAWMDARQ